MICETSPWCQPIQELYMSWSSPAPSNSLLHLPDWVTWLMWLMSQGISPLWPPFPGKEIKATLLTTSPKAVSPCFYSTLVNRVSATGGLEKCARTVILYMACLFFWPCFFLSTVAGMGNYFWLHYVQSRWHTLLRSGFFPFPLKRRTG